MLTPPPPFSLNYFFPFVCFFFFFFSLLQISPLIQELHSQIYPKNVKPFSAPLIFLCLSKFWVSDFLKAKTPICPPIAAAFMHNNPLHLNNIQMLEIQIPLVFALTFEDYLKTIDAYTGEKYHFKVAHSSTFWKIP